MKSMDLGPKKYTSQIEVSCSTPVWSQSRIMGMIADFIYWPNIEKIFNYIELFIGKKL